MPDNEDAMVSVVMPTYYRNDLLPETIESVYDQTHGNVELVVVDDSGEANARPVVEDYDDLTYIPLDENRGAQAARNVGLERISGDFVQFLDDDDILFPEKFEKQLPLFSGDVGVVYAGLEAVESGDVLRPDTKRRGEVLRSALRMRLFPCSNCTMLLDADLLEEVSPLDNTHAADDLDLFIQLAQRTQFEYVDEPLIYVRLRLDDSLGKSWDNIQARKHIVEKYDHLYGQFPPRVKRQTLSDIYRLEADKHTDENGWSPSAIGAYGRSAYYAQSDKVGRTVEFLTSFFGTPGRKVATNVRRVLSRLISNH